MKKFSATVLGEEAMVAFGTKLAAHIPGGAVIFLKGDLGMGKTTLSRGVLAAYGYEGVVKSPTYTLVEPYDLPQRTVYHFDLYRLGDPEELEYMGIRDYFYGDQVCLVEWPERACLFLPKPDLVVGITAIAKGREISVVAQSEKGEAIIDGLYAN